MRTYYNQIWTEKETNLLKKHWKSYNQRELKEKFFPDKTVNQVLQKKMGMGLKKGLKWSEKEIEILFEHGPYFTADQLSKTVLPNKTKVQIHDKRSYYEIRRTRSNS
tara:strand:- start:159 stop:479 length:321 start_codon:yes stop_codon:yes gene_type:complete